MKRQIIKKSVGFFMFAVLILAAFAVAPVDAQPPLEMLAGDFQFGPGLAQTFLDDVTLRVPARSNVGAIIELQRDLNNSSGNPIAADVTVVVEFFSPGSATPISTKIATASVVQAGVQPPAVGFNGTTSQRGCPGVWKVRIRTPNVTAPSVRVFGKVTFAIFQPETVKLAIVNGAFDLSGGANVTGTLSGHDFNGLKGDLIAGTGFFRIKAKWRSAPPLLPSMFFPLRVELLRPNGTVAAGETGFSQQAASSPKVDFTYTVTTQDAAMSGAWKLRVTSPADNPRIEGFDIEKGSDGQAPPFNSTFKAQCGGGIAVG